ncbi:hypothetical protein BDZ88DRAFT_509668 [Geranomyces variabilis]|nr:hypothetical protein BDZ88DRAFT_509668 [Geranomyces variabilis]KAJ3136438.1 hypothetical protein HDU90_003147 [Geranomyces variabilis]
MLKAAHPASCRARTFTVLLALVFFVLFSLATRHALTTAPARKALAAAKEHLNLAAAAPPKQPFPPQRKPEQKKQEQSKEELDLEPPTASASASASSSSSSTPAPALANDTSSPNAAAAVPLSRFDELMQNSLPPLPPHDNDDTVKDEAAKRRLASIERLYAMGHVPWLSYLDSLDDAGLAPLTKLAQRWIYENQHPPRKQCAKRTYLVSAGTQSIGLGAYLHKQGFGLGAALEFGLLFVLAPVGSEDGKYDFADDCGAGSGGGGGGGAAAADSQRMSSLECFTQPLSSCTFDDAMRVGHAWEKTYRPITNDTTTTTTTTTVPPPPVPPPPVPPSPVMWFGDADWRSVTHGNATFTKDMIPTYLREQLVAHFPGAQLTPAFFKLWWRGQSAAYLSRLNAKTSDALRALRLDPTLHRTWTHDDDRPYLSAPYPLPRGTMNLHVRHGDKATEMHLMPFTTYVNAAERLSSENPQMYLRRLFVSSEDPGVIEDAAWLPQRNETSHGVLTSPDLRWRVFTSDIPRVNSGPYQQINKYGASNMTRSWYLQLWMALECDAFFGTRASNWNRIIDEFRCIFVDKCQLPYFEMGPETDWRDYFW